MVLNNLGYGKIANLQSFDFARVVNILFECDVKKAKMKDIYLLRTESEITDASWDIKSSRHIGVYALFLGDELLKIGQAADNSSGIFHRMSQYCRVKDGKCNKINSTNKNHIHVEYFNLDSVEECWAAEKLLQGIAFFMGEKMLWEEKERKTKRGA